MDPQVRRATTTPSTSIALREWRGELIERRTPVGRARGHPDRRPRDPRRDRDPVRGRAPRSACPIRRCSCSAGWPRRSCPGCRGSTSSRSSSCSSSCRRCCSPPRSRRRSATSGPTSRRSSGSRSGSCSSRWSIVAVVAHAVIPGLGWAAAFALGAIVAPTDALAATTRLPPARARRASSSTLVEGEALFNDATALVAYRAAVRRGGRAARSCSCRRARRVRRSRRSAASRSGSLVGRVAARDPAPARRSAGRGR